MIPTIQYKGEQYPAFQQTGFASRFVIAFAKEVCQGEGLDVGAKYKAWGFPGARLVDIDFDERDEQGNLIEACNLPEGDFDYIFSSNTLEHVRENWAIVLEHWHSRLKQGGTLFLYLPHYWRQKYWRIWNNRKHFHTFYPKLLEDYFQDNKHLWTNSFVSEYDLNGCFAAMAEKV